MAGHARYVDKAATRADEREDGLCCEEGTVVVAL